MQEFQSPRSGKFESNRIYLGWKLMDSVGFQSPRSGKCESNKVNAFTIATLEEIGFNPLDRGNLNQIV